MVEKANGVPPVKGKGRNISPVDKNGKRMLCNTCGSATQIAAQCSKGKGKGEDPAAFAGSDQIYDDHIEYVDFPYLDSGFAGDGNTTYFTKVEYVNAANDLEDYSHDLDQSTF